MWKRELVTLLSSLSSWCLVVVVWLFLMVPLVCLQFVIVVFPDHTHLIFVVQMGILMKKFDIYKYILWPSFLKIWLEFF